MTTLTKQASTPVAKRSASTKKSPSSVPSVQDAWEEQLQTPHSKALLAAMGAKALAEHKAGKTERGGFGK